MIETSVPTPSALNKASAAHRICAIVVTFNPDIPQLVDLLLTLLNQVRQVIIVDNTGTEVVKYAVDARPELRAVVLIEFGQNLGVGAGHNKGISWASRRDYTDVLLMDQDSIPDATMVLELVATRDRLRKAGCPIAAVGPLSVDARDGHTAHFHRYQGVGRKNVGVDDADQRGVVQADVLISSGSLISLDLLHKIGGMDEGLFIDQVDTEWFLRAKAQGFAAYGVIRARLMHRLGDNSLRFWLGRWRYAPNHSPVRHYYMIRNTLLLFTRGYVPVAWRLYAVRQMLATLIFYSIFARPQHQHLIKMLRGLLDGLRGRTGAFE